MNRRKYLYTAAYTAGAFFGARCMVFGMLCPVGSAYLALSVGDKGLWLALPAAALGTLTRHREVYSWGYICAYVLLGLVNIAVMYFKKEVDLGLRSAVGGICSFLGGLVYAASNNFGVYYVLLALLQGVLTVLLTAVFSEGVEYGTRKRSTGAVSLALLTGFVCGGMEGISLLGIPAVVIGITCFLPFLTADYVTEGENVRFIKQGIISRLGSFSDAMDTLSRAVGEIAGDKNDGSMLGRELSEISRLTEELSCSIKNGMDIDRGTGRRVCECLKKEGIPFEGVVAYGKGSRMCVEITKKQRENCERCTRNIVSRLNRGLGIRLTKSECIHRGDMCTMLLRSERPWRIAACASTRKRDGSSVSGDSHILTELKSGRYMLALSDGMGSGDMARAESAASVELFEDFMEAGFECDTALERINSLMLIKGGGEDIFATMDVCTVDLYTGKAEFIKTGGMPGFIRGKKGVRLVGNGGLPIGIIEKMNRERIHIKLEDGDIIVMVTDGVTEAAPCEVGKEGWLSDIIEKNASLPVDGIAEKIIEEAVEAQKGRINDDMTVIAAKVWKT